MTHLQFKFRIFPLLSFLLVFLPALKCLAADSPIGTITQLQGSASITRPGSGRITVHRGVGFLVGDVLATEGTGAAQIGLLDGSFINVAPGSSVRVNQYAFDEAEGRISLRSRVISGIARFNAPARHAVGSLIFVESGSAAITGGTPADFTVSCMDGIAEVAVLSNGVSVRNASSLIVGTVSLGVNQKSMVRPKTAPTMPEVISQHERRMMAIIVR